MFESDHPKAAVKLIDFGLSKKYLKKEHIFTDRVGTIYSMAPEVINGSYSNQADMWSLGVVAYMLVTDRMPFLAQTRKEMAGKIVNEKLVFHESSWAGISDKAKTFVQSLLERNTQKRLSSGQARTAPWLTSKMNHIDSSIQGQIHKSIANYAYSTGEMKKVALTVLAHKSASEEIHNLRDIFNTIDSHNTGFISKEEFRDAFKKSDFSDDDLDNIFQAIDISHDGRIHYTEFLAATLEMQGRITEKNLAEAFDRVDSDDTGFISKENLSNILGTNCSLECIEQIMNEVDSNDDGKISYEDFMSAFYSQKNQELVRCSDFLNNNVSDDTCCK